MASTPVGPHSCRTDTAAGIAADMRTVAAVAAVVAALAMRAAEQLEQDCTRILAVPVAGVECCEQLVQDCIHTPVAAAAVSSVPQYILPLQPAPGMDLAEHHTTMQAAQTHHTRTAAVSAGAVVERKRCTAGSGQRADSVQQELKSCAARYSAKDEVAAACIPVGSTVHDSPLHTFLHACGDHSSLYQVNLPVSWNHESLAAYLAVGSSSCELRARSNSDLGDCSHTIAPMYETNVRNIDHGIPMQTMSAKEAMLGLGDNCCRIGVCMVDRSLTVAGECEIYHT